MNRIKKIILIILGTLFLIIGIVGILLPLLPTTPFLLLAASCYLHSSQKYYDLLISNKWIGKYIKNYREKKGIPKKTKIVSILFLWLTIGFSVVFVAGNMYMRIGLVVIALAVTVHIIKIKTLSETDLVLSTEDEGKRQQG